jgi:hypothetical protein
MEGMPPQRVDIAQVVGEYEGKSHGQVQEELAQAPPPRVYPSRAEGKGVPPEVPGLWYVVVDEIIEERVTLEAWPWPTVDALTHYLSFDLRQTRRWTVDAVAIHRVVCEHRVAHEPEATAYRPLRIGDVFKVTTPKITDLSTWTAVSDHTQEKRAEVRAAVDAMATPPHTTDKAEKLERMARVQQPAREEQPAVERTADGIKAHSVV